MLSFIVVQVKCHVVLSAWQVWSLVGLSIKENIEIKTKKRIKKHDHDNQHVLISGHTQRYDMKLTLPATDLSLSFLAGDDLLCSSFIAVVNDRKNTRSLACRSRTRPMLHVN